MNDVRVILLTVTGPGGRSADVGARSDATPRDLAAQLGPALGIDPASSVVKHHAPERPGGQSMRQRLVRADAPLADSGVLDGDTLVFTRAGAQFQPAQPPSAGGAAAPPAAPPGARLTAPGPPAPPPGPAMAIPPQPYRG